MKKMKYIAVTFVICSLLSLFTACSKRKDGSVDPKSKTVHILVWESHEEAIRNFMREAGKAYTQKHPNVVVDFVADNYTSIIDNVENLGPKGLGPDLFAAPHDRLGDIVNKNLVLPTVNQEEVKKSVLGACSKALTYNGKMYGYPLSAETYALFYNTALIDEKDVPSTFEDLVSWSQAFQKKNPGKYGFIMDYYNGYYSIIFTTLRGNRLFGDSGTDVSKSYLATPEAIEGMKYMQSLHKALGYGNLVVNSSTADGLFTSGNAAMHVTGLWNVKGFEQAGVKFNVAALPSLPGESSPAASFSGTRGIFVSSYSKHPDEAADFAKFLLTPEMQKLRNKYTGTMPSVNVQVDSKYMSGFIKQLDYAFPMPSIPQMGKFWGEAGGWLGRIWNGMDVELECENIDRNILK